MSLPSVTKTKAFIALTPGVNVAAAGWKATAVAAEENEMNLGRLPPARAVTLTMAPALEVTGAGAVTRRRPEVDIDSGEDGGVNV